MDFFSGLDTHVLARFRGPEAWIALVLALGAAAGAVWLSITVVNAAVSYLKDVAYAFLVVTPSILFAQWLFTPGSKDAIIQSVVHWANHTVAGA